MSHVVKSILSTSFVVGLSSIVFNLKARFCKENAWQVRGTCIDGVLVTVRDCGACL